MYQAWIFIFWIELRHVFYKYQKSLKKKCNNLWCNRMQVIDWNGNVSLFLHPWCLLFNVLDIIVHKHIFFRGSFYELSKAYQMQFLLVRSRWALFEYDVMIFYVNSWMILSIYLLDGNIEYHTTSSYAWISFRNTHWKRHQKKWLKDIQEHKSVKKFLTNKQKQECYKNEKNKRKVLKNCNVIHSAVNC